MIEAAVAAAYGDDFDPAIVKALQGLIERIEVGGGNHLAIGADHGLEASHAARPTHVAVCMGVDDDTNAGH